MQALTKLLPIRCIHILLNLMVYSLLIMQQNELKLKCNLATIISITKLYLAVMVR